MEEVGTMVNVNRCVGVTVSARRARLMIFAEATSRQAQNLRAAPHTEFFDEIDPIREL